LKIGSCAFDIADPAAHKREESSTAFSHPCLPPASPKQFTYSFLTDQIGLFCCDGTNEAALPVEAQTEGVFAGKPNFLYGFQGH
jgi:hypothetical protein